MQAGQARLRPIAITALSTILALLPLAMGKAEYVAAIGAPFAVAVIGGLLAGTLFTLVLVPTVYAGLEHGLAWLRGLGGRTWAAQLAALALGAWLIHEHVDALLWRIVDGTVLLGVVPVMTWFLQTSLRRTRARLIPEGEPLRVSVASLGKIYDEEPRFLRQWRRGERQRARLRAAGEPEGAGRLGSLRWQLPLLGFHFYFAYLYLDSDFWALVFSVAFVLFLAGVVRPFLPRPRSPSGGSGWSAGCTRPCSGCCPWATSPGTRAAGTTGPSPSSWGSCGTWGRWSTGAPAGSTAARSTSTAWPGASGAAAGCSTGAWGPCP